MSSSQQNHSKYYYVSNENMSEYKNTLIQHQRKYRRVFNELREGVRCLRQFEIRNIGNDIRIPSNNPKPSTQQIETPSSAATHNRRRTSRKPTP